MINKISTPVVEDIIPRWELFARLDEIRRTSSVWLSGPAGAGKSTLMAGYLKDRCIPHIWYRIDRRDSDLATFFYYLGMAAPLDNHPMPMFLPEYKMDVGTFVTQYFENLKKRISGSSWIVLDNYQDLPASSPLHGLVNLVIKMFSPNPGLVIISRNNPPKSMARLLANRQIKKICWPEIAFSLEESRNVVRLITPEKFSNDEIKMLHENTKGWVAGLILWLQNMDENKHLPFHFSNETPASVFDYFGSELLDHIGQQTRTFLLKTAFLPEMTSAMANQLTGMESGAEILAKLQRQNYFISQHSHITPKYEYHPLFSDFLRSQASRFFSSEQLNQIKYRAATIAAESSLPEYAADLFAQCRAWDKLSELIQIHGYILFSQGRYLTLSKWLHYFPDKNVMANPWLIYWKGLSLLPESPLKGRNNCETAFVAFKKAEDHFGQILSLIAILESFFIIRGNMKALDNWFIEGEQLADKIDMTQADETSCRFIAVLLSAFALRGLNHPSLAAWIDRCIILLNKVSDFHLQVILGNFLSLIYCWKGEVTKASGVIERIRPAAAYPNLSPLSLIQFKIMECVYYLVAGETDRCRSAIEIAMSISEKTGVRVFDSFFASYSVQISLALGDMENARNYLYKMAGYLNPESGSDLAHYLIFCAWESYVADKYDPALDQLKTALGVCVENGVPAILTLNARLLEARVLLASGDTDQAMTCLKSCIGQARKTGCLLVEFQEQMTCALFSFHRSDASQGLSYLKTAFQLSRKKGVLEGYWWQRGLLAGLCEKALEAGIEKDQVRLFISRYRLEPQNPCLTGPHWPWPIQIKTLGSFEILSDDVPLKFSSKSPKKTLELMMLLICQGVKGVYVDYIMDELWPDADGDRARQNYNTTLHRLRKLLDRNQAVVMDKGHLRLASTICSVDAWHFEAMAEQNLDHLSSGDRIALLEKALALYKGHFTGSLTQNSAIIAYADNMRTLWIKTVIRTSRELSASGRFKESVEVFQKALSLDDTIEPFYQLLIQTLMDHGLQSEALTVFTRCRNTLAAKLRMKPGIQTMELYNKLKSFQP